MTITRLYHAQITVLHEGEATARGFYRELLGLPELARTAALAEYGGFRVRLGDQQLHIGVGNGGERDATKAHLAYGVADLAVWRARLATAGTVVIASVPLPGYMRFECRDPFGNRRGFIQPRDVAAADTNARAQD